MEYFPEHPNDKEEGEHDPPPQDVFLGCVFSHYRNFSEKVEVEANDVSAPAMTFLQKMGWHMHAVWLDIFLIVSIHQGAVLLF